MVCGSIGIRAVFFDTWMLLAYLAGETGQVRFVPDVLNLPLRLTAE